MVTNTTTGTTSATNATTRVSSKRRFGYDGSTMTPIHWTLASLAAATGTLHAYLYVIQESLPFLFAAAVFYAAIVALLLNVYRPVLYALGIPFTAGQIVAWYALGMPDVNVAVLDKPIQIVMIVLLAYLLYADWWSRR